MIPINRDHTIVRLQAPGLDVAVKEGLNNLLQQKVEIEESIKSLDSKILILNSSEDFLQQQVNRVKGSLVAILTRRHEELSKGIRRLSWESWKSKLERTHTQIAQALQFLDDVLSKKLEVSDDKISHIQEIKISQEVKKSRSQ